MPHHPRRILVAAALFVAAALLYQLWRGNRPGYGLFDLLRGRPDTAAGASFTAQDGPKLSDNDVPALAQFSEESTKLAAAVLPSVVSISTATVSPVAVRDVFGFLRGYRYNVSPGLGSGVIISKEGHVVTNYHVIKDAAQIKIITNDGSKHDAEIIGANEEVDIAVLRIVGGKDFPALSFANSDEVKVGQVVFAVGNPFGLTGTVTQGIISATQRKISDSDRYLLQTDTVINPGNSGGPLVNIHAEIVGINVALFAGEERIHTWQGVGLTIPSNEAKAALEGIMHGGGVKPPTGSFLGLRFNSTPVSVDPSVLPTGAGALIEQVIPGSPAEQAGLQLGDIVIKLGGRTFATPEELTHLIHEGTPGQMVKITVVRGNQIAEIPITFRKTP